MERLGGKEVNSILGYIGGEGGYLANFTYASHAQFYPMYCGVDIDPNEFQGQQDKDLQEYYPRQNHLFSRRYYKE